MRGFVEFVAFGFEVDGLDDGGFQFGIATAAAQQGAEFKLFVLPQTHVGGAVDGNADAVAGLAKVLRHRGDETDVEATVL